MLRSKLIHPEISAILARAGHHAKILIADGHYPVTTKRGPRAELVSLNLMPGVVTCGQVLEAVLSAVAVEVVNTMLPETSGPYVIAGDPPVWNEFRGIVRQAGLPLELTPLEKWEFYSAVDSPDHVLTIQTADLQRFANVLLTVGVRMDV